MLPTLQSTVELAFSKSQVISVRGSYVKGMFNSALKWQEKLTELSRKDKKKVP